MSAYTHPLARAIPQGVRQLVWFALVCTVAFFLPYLGISVLDMQHDVFYLAYFAVTLALLAAYVRVEHVDVAESLCRRWQWSLGIGVVLAAFLVFNVFNTEHATARPHGLYFVFELLWRGVGYGLIDTLLLTVCGASCRAALARSSGPMAHVGGDFEADRIYVPHSLVRCLYWRWARPMNELEKAFGCRADSAEGSNSENSEPMPDRAAYEPPQLGALHHAACLELDFLALPERRRT
jgi:hypothetical protein